MPSRFLLALLPALALALVLPGGRGLHAQAMRDPAPALQSGPASPAHPAAAAGQPAARAQPTPAASAADRDDAFPDFSSDPATRRRPARVHYRVEERHNTYPDGTLRTRWQVRIGPDGHVVRDGTLVRYHPNGKLALVGAYRNGHPSGVWHWFDAQGEPMRAAVPQPGYEEILSGRDLENPDTVYRDLQGRKVAEGVLKYDQPVGPWRYYYPDGALRARGRFVRGLPDGRWVVYFNSGMVQREDTYQLGVPDGPVRRGWPDGSDRLQGRISQGLRVGRWRTWYANGQIESDGDYREDRRQGDWRFWNDQGRLLRHVRYSAGHIVAELPLPKPRVGPPPVIPEPRLLPFRPRVYDRSGKQIRFHFDGSAIVEPAPHASPGRADGSAR